MSIIQILLVSTLLISVSCKQKTKLLQKKEENKEIIINYSPFVDSESEIGNFIPNKIEYILNLDNIEGSEMLSVNDIPELTFTNPSFIDILENPEVFRTPVLSDFCSNDDAEFVAHKYKTNDVEKSLIYAFSIIGRCDGEDVRCAVLYVTNEDIMSMMPSPYVFQYPYGEALIMGIEGESRGCQKIKDIINPAYGCSNPNASNFDPMAIIDDGSCFPIDCHSFPQDPMCLI